MLDANQETQSLLPLMSCGETTHPARNRSLCRLTGEVPLSRFQVVLVIRLCLTVIELSQVSGAHWLELAQIEQNEEDSDRYAQRAEDIVRVAINWQIRLR